MKRLRNKMILAVFLSSVLVFLIICVVANLAFGYQNVQQADGMTEIISLNNGNVPEMDEYKEKQYESRLFSSFSFNEESSHRTRYFIVALDDNLNVTSANTEHIAAISQAEAVTMAADAIKQGKTTGYIGSYRYRLATDNDSQNILVFLDCYENLQFQRKAFQIMLVICCSFSLMVTLIFAVFTSRILRPFEENTNRQKQFITNASHELKTPLAIISANSEVLQYKHGENEWTGNIITQTKRMDKLINELLLLAKMDEANDKFPLSSLNYSDLIRETTAHFKEIIEQKKVSLEQSVPDKLMINGNREQLSQLISILMENAAKYVTENGVIRLHLKQSGRSAVLTLFNTCAPDPGLDCSRLFDRFYRSDQSHTSKTGGHGIGLSVAKRITEQHGGTITAEQTADGILFTLKLSCNLRRG